VVSGRYSPTRSPRSCQDFAAPSADSRSLAAEQVRVTNVRCRTARSVIRYYARRYPESKPGWKCRTARNSGRSRCTRRTSVIGFVFVDRE
jgi:hypothetical protein